MNASLITILNVGSYKYCYENGKFTFIWSFYHKNIKREIIWWVATYQICPSMFFGSTDIVRG